MKKLLLLAIPLLLFGFTFPGDSPKKEKFDDQVFGTLYVTCCTGDFIRVRITAPVPSTNIYWHINGLHVGTNNKFLDVPKTANSVYATTGTSYPGTMYAGNMVSELSCTGIATCP